jgi:membrane dipeptidase
MHVTRRQFIAAASAAALAPCLRLFAADAAGIYERSIVVDGLGGPGGMGTDRGEPLTAAQVDDVRRSGLTCAHVTVGYVGTVPPLEAFETIVRSIAFWEREIDAHPDVLARVRAAGDLDAAKASGRTGLVYGLQDGVSFETDLERLRVLHQLGIRVVQPTYNRRNLLGDGCMEPADAGLSRAGHDAVALMNELGILVDLSHCGRRTTADAIAASSAPVSFTHTGCAAVTEHPRHRTDEELRRVADGGGVIGIYVMPYLAGGRQPAAADVIAHLEHAIEVAGEDHVGIGTDGYVSATTLTDEYREAFARNVRERRESGIAAPGETETGYLFASDLNTPRRFETLTGMLMERGHGEARIEKLLGGNFRRLFESVWG